jgi:protein gp37
MTKIEWTDETLNPTTGCDRVSPGCDNCYALTMARRLKAMGSAKYQNDGDPKTSGPGFGITEHPDVLTAPLRWRKPRKVFVNSTSDLFHKGVSDEFIARLWAVMAATPQHTYQILTKRPARMRTLLRDECRCGGGHQPGVHLRSAMDWASTRHSPTYVPGLEPGLFHRIQWPLPNVWLGVSVEDQKRADLRIPALLDTPAAVRFLSCEPLLGPLNLDECLYKQFLGRDDHGPRAVPALHWVIIGGESGPGARRMELAWAQSLVDQCRAAGIAPFVKQLGSAHGPHKGGDITTWPAELQVREYPTAVES